MSGMDWLWLAVVGVLLGITRWREVRVRRHATRAAVCATGRQLQQVAAWFHDQDEARAVLEVVGRAMEELPAGWDAVPPDMRRDTEKRKRVLLLWRDAERNAELQRQSAK